MCIPYNNQKICSRFSMKIPILSQSIVITRLLYIDQSQYLSIFVYGESMGILCQTCLRLIFLVNEELAWSKKYFIFHTMCVQRSKKYKKNSFEKWKTRTKIFFRKLSGCHLLDVQVKAWLSSFSTLWNYSNFQNVRLIII